MNTPDKSRNELPIGRSGRPSPEVYAEFYREYGSTESRLGMMAAGRVVHIGELPYSGAVHLIMHEQNGNAPLDLSRPLDPATGKAYDNFRYDPDSFTVTTTDGVSIQNWRTMSANGRHHGLIDGVQHLRDEQNVTVELDLLSAEDEEKDYTHVRLAVSRTMQTGTLTFDNGATGWILDEMVSRGERTNLLAQAGHLPGNFEELAS